MEPIKNQRLQDAPVPPAKIQGQAESSFRLEIKSRRRGLSTWCLSLASTFQVKTKGFPVKTKGFLFLMRKLLKQQKHTQYNVRHSLKFHVIRKIKQLQILLAGSQKNNQQSTMQATQLSISSATTQNKRFSLPYEKTA
jgi:hypothetical protein